MPMYDYACRACENTFRDMKRIADRDQPCEEPCEKCGGEIYKPICAPKVLHDRDGATRVPSDFKDVLKGMKRATTSKLGGDKSTIETH